MRDITSPAVFFTTSAIVVLYIVSMMVRRRRGERPGQEGREPEL